MTRGEYAAFVATIRGLWGRKAVERPEDEHEVAFRMLADLPADEAVAALRRLAARDPEWPPEVAQVIAEASGGVVDDPAWADTRDLLVRAASSFGREREADALLWLHGKSDHAARLAVEIGWRQWCREELDSPEHGGAVNARLEKSYASLVAGMRQERSEGRVLDVVARRLAWLGEGGGRGELRRPSFGVLGTGERAA